MFCFFSSQFSFFAFRFSCSNFCEQRLIHHVPTLRHQISAMYSLSFFPSLTHTQCSQKKALFCTTEISPSSWGSWGEKCGKCFQKRAGSCSFPCLMIYRRKNRGLGPGMILAGWLLIEGKMEGGMRHI